MTWDELERAVRKLDPETRDTGDRIWIIKCCGRTVGYCKRSRARGRKKDIGRVVAGQIPAELGIDRALWRDIAGCSKGRREYLEARGHSGHA